MLWMISGTFNYRLITAYYLTRVKLYNNNAPRDEVGVVRTHEAQPSGELDHFDFSTRCIIFVQFHERQVKSSY